MTPRTITGAHRIYVLPKERNKSEYVDYCAQSTTLVEALTKDSLVEHLIIKCSDPWGFVFPEQLVSQTEREKPLRITLLLTEHIDHVRGNLPRWEEFIARARTEGKLKGQVYKSGWQDCVVPRGVYVPSGLMTRIACRDKGKYASNFPDPTKGGKQEDNFTYRFITDASLATGSTAEELAQIRAYFGVDLSHLFKPIRKIKNGIVTDTQADMWVYEFLYARQMIEAHGASSGVYMNMLYWLNASEANITDFWEVAEATEDTARELEGKLDKPTSGKYILDKDIPSHFEELMKASKTEWRNLLISDEEHTTEEEIATTDYLYRKLLLSRKHTFVIGDYYTLSMDVQVPNDASGLDDYNIFDWNGHVNKYGYRGDTFTIHNGRNHITFKWGEAGSELSNVGLLLYRNFDYSENPNTTKYTIKTANFTLVKGKEGMDTYTPAPEDMLAELSKYTTIKKYNEDREEDRRKLEGKLDKPTSGKYILDTEISDRIKKKITGDTDLQKLIKGEKGDDAGRYLGRAKRIHPDFNGNYLLETESTWKTANEGDYVYVVGDLSNRGGDKDTYYIVREHKNNTVWEVYDIKGSTPKLTFDEQFRLLADGVLVSQQTLKGDPGRNPNPSDVADLIANSKTYRDQITYGLPDEERVKELARELDEERKVGGRNLIKDSKNTLSNGNYFVGKYDIADPSQMVAGEEYTIQVWGTIAGADFSEVLWVYNSGGNTQVASIQEITNGVWKQTFKWRDDADKSNSYLNLFRAANHPDNNKSFNTTITKIKLERGNVATDWTPAPEDFLAELDTAKAALTYDIGRARSRADEARYVADRADKGVKSVKKEVNDLQKNSLTEIEKEWVGKMGSILFPNMDDSPQNKGGLTVDHSVFLRFSDGKPSALIGGQIGKGAVLMAGVQDYGTTNQSARTEIYQDGSAKFGDVNLSDKTITLMPKKGLPLRVTAEEGTFIENFLANSKDDRYIAYEKSFVVVGKGEVQTYSFDVANNDTKLTITIPKLTSEVYQINQSVILTLDGVTLGSWHEDTKLIREDTSGIVGGGVHFRKENTPLVVENLQFERYLSSGSHTLSVSVTSTDTRDKATITKLTAHLYYDASQAETILTHKGFRAFGGQNRYFDIDWSWTYRAKGYFTTSNPYIARVKGGMRLDRLELEQPLDAPGCVLAGGRVENGYVNASFGKYKNQRGYDKPKAKFDSNDKIYAVFHSIGNTNYTPIVTSCAGQWGDVPQVIGVYAYRFDVRFINFNNEPSVGWNFNYVCYKGD